MGMILSIPSIHSLIYLVDKDMDVVTYACTVSGPTGAFACDMSLVSCRFCMGSRVNIHHDHEGHQNDSALT